MRKQRRLSGYETDDQHCPMLDRLVRRRMCRVDGSPFPLEETPAARAIRRGETVIGETMVFHLPQATHWVVVSAAPILLEDATCHGAVATLTDITEFHAIQERMKMFVQMVSHDLRAPLTVIQGHLSLLQDFITDSEDAIVRCSTEAMGRSAKRMDVMIDDLVEAARLEGGHLQLELQAVVLQEFLPAFLARNAGVLHSERIRLDIPTDLVAVQADDSRLERILTNLLTNAHKYSSPQTPILLQVWQTDGAVAIAISDQGQGIPPQ